MFSRARTAGWLAASTLLLTLVGCGGQPSTGSTAADPAPPIPSVPADPTPAPPSPDAGPEHSITNLYDAFGRDREGVTFDFGFAALVRYGDLTILFDGGSHEEVFRRNVEALGIDLRAVDVVVLSHNHPDHAAGIHVAIEANPDVKVYLPADGFLGGWLPFDYMRDRESLDALPAEQRYRAHRSGRVGIEGSGPYYGANVEYVGEHREIAPGVSLVFTRAEAMGYYMAYPPHEDEPRRIPLAELSLTLTTADGEALVVGCSRSTVETIVAATRAHLERPIDLVYGGYHLLPYSEEALRGIAGRLADEHGVERVAPAHCTGPRAFRILRERFGDRYLFAGLGERLELAAP